MKKKTEKFYKDLIQGLKFISCNFLTMDEKKYIRMKRKTQLIVHDSCLFKHFSIMIEISIANNYRIYFHREKKKITFRLSFSNNRIFLNV